MVRKLVLNQGKKQKLIDRLDLRSEADLDPDPESDQGQRDANASRGI